MPKLKQPSLRQRKFANEYLKTGKAKHSAIVAGYSPKTASQIATKLLTLKDVEKLINLGGQIGLNTLVDVSLNSKVDIARVNAANSLVDRAYGKAKNNDADRGKVPNITIQFNRIDTSGQVIEGKTITDTKAVDSEQS